MAFPAALSCALGISVARADIYTWTDAAGHVNISNLTPPDGARVTSVLRETPKPVAPRPEPSVDAAVQANMLVLAERVRQLEREVDRANQQSPPPPIYVAAPAPAQPGIQYSYAMDPQPPAPSYGYGCDPSWTGCGYGYGWSPFGYPASVVVLRSPGLHRPRGFHGMRGMAVQQPGRPPGRPPGGMRGR